MKECRVIFIMAMNICLWHKITLRQKSPFSCCFISCCNEIPPSGASNKQVKMPQTQCYVIIFLSFSIGNSKLPFIKDSRCVLESFRGITAPPPLKLRIAVSRKQFNPSSLPTPPDEKTKIAV